MDARGEFNRCEFTMEGLMSGNHLTCRRLVVSKQFLVAIAAVVLSAGCSSAGPVATLTPPANATSLPTETTAATPLEKPAAETRTAAAELTPAIDSTSQPAIETRPASPASFNTPPTTQPTVLSSGAFAQPTSAPAIDLVDAFDAQLVRMIHGDASADPSLAALPADERDLLTTVADCLASFRQSLKDPQSLMATRVAPLIELSDRIRAQTPLSLPTLAVCRSVTQFGVYDPFESASFTAGKETPIIVYAEIENFASKPATDGRWETTLSYAAVVYSDNEHSVPVITRKPTTIVDRCRNRRRDFFLADRLTLPANLPVGKYVMKITVVDQQANHVAEKTVPILIAPN
jgi:hypothetical protein